MKILITGGAGLVGQNLLKLIDHSKHQVTVIDKNLNLNNKIKSYYPNINVINIDLSNAFKLKKLKFEFDCIVIMQAQIKGFSYDEFYKNTVVSTQNIINLVKIKKCVPYIIHISSSVINSGAHDFYTRSKRKQETLIKNWNIKKIILRPTLMYGLGDIKHFYVLINLMRKIHFFAVPGKGNFIRQPLFALDFAHVINDCIERPREGIFNISGLELITFKECLVMFKKQYKLTVLMIPIPLFIFRYLLRITAILSNRVPFTEQQFNALIIPETFERIDWPTIFNTSYTRFEDGIKQFSYEFK